MISKIRDTIDNFLRVIRMLLGKSKLNKGMELEESGEYEKAVEFYTEEIEQENDEYIKSYLLMRKGMSLLNLNRSGEALNTINHASQLAEELEDDFLISNTNLIAADLLRRFDKPKKALERYKKSIKFSNDNETLGAAHLGIGIMKKEDEFYDEAEEQMKKALNLFEDGPDLDKQDVLKELRDLYDEVEDLEKSKEITKKLEKLEEND